MKKMLSLPIIRLFLTPIMEFGNFGTDGAFGVGLFGQETLIDGFFLIKEDGDAVLKEDSDKLIVTYKLR